MCILGHDQTRGIYNKKIYSGQNHVTFIKYKPITCVLLQWHLFIIIIPFALPLPVPVYLYEGVDARAASNMAQLFMLLKLGPPPAHRVVGYEGPWRQEWRAHDAQDAPRNARCRTLVVSFVMRDLREPPTNADSSTDETSGESSGDSSS